MRETICYFTRVHMYTLLTTSEREKERDHADLLRRAYVQICTTDLPNYSSLLERISAPAAASDEAMGITKPLEPTHTHIYILGAYTRAIHILLSRRAATAENTGVPDRAHLKFEMLSNASMHPVSARVNLFKSCLWPRVYLRARVCTCMYAGLDLMLFLLVHNRIFVALYVSSRPAAAAAAEAQIPQHNELARTYI
ncbi:unnamed protein product [Trichogramma brassicae]|uniref:Uncharacterized protein n=1 Tax=Trichogramma brassicae TaxID=86971 RepID=A0A6H5HYL8_9HYME|nr:unnamed protein product [Trichogramma brassicae]